MRVSRARHHLFVFHLPCFDVIGLVGWLVPFLNAVSVLRLTGRQAAYTQKIQKFLGYGRAELHASMSKLLPPHLMKKLRNRKLVRASLEDEKMSGRPFKLL